VKGLYICTPLAGKPEHHAAVYNAKWPSSPGDMIQMNARNTGTNIFTASHDMNLMSGRSCHSR